MRILAIDPGSTHSAYVLWDGSLIQEKGKIPNEDLLAYLWGEHDPDDARFSLVAIEKIASYGMAVGAEVFDTCIWVGRYMEASPATVRLITRAKVKSHICHTQKATDSNIRQALIDIYGQPRDRSSVTFGLKADTWSAFALAITAAECPE